MSLVTLVSYCSNEKEFIERVLHAAVLLSDLVCLAFGNRLYNGTPESIDDMNKLSEHFPMVQFVMYDVPDSMLSHPIDLHNRARKCALNAAKQTMEKKGMSDFWVLLLDADEIPRNNGSDFNEWKQTNLMNLDKTKGYKLSTFWYFLQCNLVSQGEQDSMVLVHVSTMTDAAMNSFRERDGICYEITFAGGEIMRHIHGTNGLPMFDHFAWVRGLGREGLLKKVANWGHTIDKNWNALIHDAFDEIERGSYPPIDFIHGWKVFVIDENSMIQPSDFYIYHTLHL